MKNNYEQYLAHFDNFVSSVGYYATTDTFEIPVDVYENPYTQVEKLLLE